MSSRVGLTVNLSRNFFKSFISGLRYNVLLRIFIESYLDLTISAILNMTDVILVNP